MKSRFLGRRIVLGVGAAGLLSVVIWIISLSRIRPLPDAAERFSERVTQVTAAVAAARYQAGERAGEAAVRKGHFAVYEVGLPMPGYEDYQRLLLEKYGVEVHNVGCMQVATEADWQNGFTAATKKQLVLTYRHDVFEECDREARRLSEARVKCD